LKTSEVEEFLKSNGIYHKCSAPYHPAFNGQAETFVQIMKQSLRAIENKSGDVPLKLSRFLMQHRITQHTTHDNKEKPTRNDVLTKHQKPSKNHMRSNLQQERNSATYTSKIRFYNDNSEWKFGTVLKQTRPLHYTVLVDGK
jgi:transposase InsO family protein